MFINTHPFYTRQSLGRWGENDGWRVLVYIYMMCDVWWLSKRKQHLARPYASLSRAHIALGVPRTHAIN